VSLDAVLIVPFLRAVRARERPEMTQVFMLYRDAAGLVAPAIFSILLSFFELRSVFLSAGLALLAAAWLARFIPRSM
jgi:hypothetical protein